MESGYPPGLASGTMSIYMQVAPALRDDPTGAQWYFRLERVTALDGPASECREMKFLWTCSLQAGKVGKF